MNKYWFIKCICQVLHSAPRTWTIPISCSASPAKCAHLVDTLSCLWLMKQPSYKIIYGHPRPSVALTNANRQLLRVVPWTSHSALVPSTLALLVTLEVEKCSRTTSSTLIHLIPAVPRHQLALWVVPLYCSGHWSWCGLDTVHSLNPPDNQRHIRCWAAQASVVILQESSRDCSERCQKEQLRQRAGA